MYRIQNEEETMTTAEVSHAMDNPATSHAVEAVPSNTPAGMARSA